MDDQVGEPACPLSTYAQCGEEARPVGMFLFSSPTGCPRQPRSPGNKALHRNSGCPKSRRDILLLVL